jgi:glycosyltransferase involved in cell wall biosynthesis
MYDLQHKKVVFLDDYDYTNEDHVVITFDGVYKNVLEYAAPILQKFEYPFELFITGDYIGKDNKWDVKEPYAKFSDIDDLKKLIRMGGRLQWHTKSHRDMDGLENINRIEDELSVPQFLSELDPKGFKWFAFPHGNYSPTVLREVRKKFKGSLSCDQGKSNDWHTLKRLIVTNESKFNSTTVAVIIASYNYGAFLVEAIESVLRQTILPHEILITDDFSNDSTQEIALEYKNKYPAYIKYNRNNVNMGIVKNFNKAVSLTSSDYILFLGADNRLLSNYIEVTKKFLDSSEKIGISYSDFALFGPRAKVVYSALSENFRGEIRKEHFIINFPDWDKHSKELLKKRNFIHGSSMYRRKAFDDVKGYLEETSLAEDRDLFYRMVKSGWEATKAHGTFLEYRQHSKQQANMQRATYSELVFYKEKYRELLDEKQRLSRFFIYKLLIPFMVFEKAYCILRKEGFKEFFIRGTAFLKRKLFGRSSR